MANPFWKKGGPSPNPAGRRKSNPSISRKLELFVKRQIGGRKLQELYDKLKPAEKVQFLSTVLPYVSSKKPMEATLTLNSLTDSQLDSLYNKVMAGAGMIGDNTEDVGFELLNDVKNDGQTTKN